jgi:hypothetical protein
VSGPSPLGRYAEGDPSGPQAQDAAADRLVEVRLLRLPVAVHVAARERHDSVLRECALLAAEVEHRPDLPADFVELVSTLGIRYGAVRPRPDAVIEQALDEGLDVVDVTYHLPPGAGAAADALERLMAAADRFCDSGHLLTLPRSQLDLRFSAWYLGQITTQLAGAPPQPWDGPLLPPA